MKKLIESLHFWGFFFDTMLILPNFGGVLLLFHWKPSCTTPSKKQFFCIGNERLTAGSHCVAEVLTSLEGTSSNAESEFFTTIFMRNLSLPAKQEQGRTLHVPTRSPLWTIKTSFKCSVRKRVQATIQPANWAGKVRFCTEDFVLSSNASLQGISIRQFDSSSYILQCGSAMICSQGRIIDPAWKTYDKNVWQSLWQNTLPHQIATHFGGHLFVEISLGFRWTFRGNSNY